VAEVEGRIGVGQGSGDEQLAGHGGIVGAGCTGDGQDGGAAALRRTPARARRTARARRRPIDPRRCTGIPPPVLR
jgi:hypothetical protein